MLKHRTGGFEMVTISWSFKNFVTVNLMVFAMGAGLALVSRAVQNANGARDER